ncbi:ATP-grasp domain-containing protein [Micromonospora saelicesensis]|uniref:ATP-grasp domain-containing protein n=1 Tax=Micromonospora saelicesensis TaxID=285676 RepID=UPI000DC3BAF9|nr:ATP-grasp domain-containing protein [Micromonospora saelicesensis]RAO62596.1 Argininosuccinate lyase [Micromonospora saelicesensis]
MLIIVQPLSAGIALASRLVAAGVPCLIPTQFPDLLPAEVHSGARVVDWHPDDGVPALLDLVDRLGVTPTGVIAGFEYAVGAAAELARALGLPALSQDTAEAVRQKDVMRERCFKHGIAVPASITVPADEVGECPFAFPAVVKPADWGGSLMVRLVRDADEYQRACAEIHRYGEVKFHHDPRRVALVEEYVDGPEFSLEGWVDTAGPHIVSITTKLLSAPPQFFEMGHVATPPQRSPHGRLLHEFAAQVVAAFDITVGPFHIETRIAADGHPVLIEVGARLAGDCIPELVMAGPGVDLYLAAAEAARGGRYVDQPVSSVSAGLAFVTTDRPGVFAGSLSGTEPFLDADEFVRIVFEAERGAALDPDDIFHNRVAQVHFVGDPGRVEDLVGAVLRDVRVDISDKEGNRS